MQHGLGIMNLQTLYTYDNYAYAFIAVVGTFTAVVAIYRLMLRSFGKQWLTSLHGVTRLSSTSSVFYLA